MAFPSGTAYHADSDADDEYERSVMASPTQIHDDSEASPTDSEPPSNEHTPTTFGGVGEDNTLPRTIITEWTAEESAQFIASLGLRQYCDAFIENEIVGEALVALKHEELKEMGIASVGHRLTILKNVYDAKTNQDIPVEPDHYVPPSAERNPQYEMATKDDVQRIARSMIKLRDERVAQAEDSLRRLADDYRKLRQELLPVFKMAKERSEPLPYAPYQTSGISPEMYQQEVTSPPVTQPPPEKTSLTRTLSKKLFLGSTPKNNSPTHVPNTIHEGKTLTDSSSLDPSAAATSASNQLTASMSGGTIPSSSPNIPSPTSPAYQYPPLAARSYQRDGGITPSIPRYDGTEDMISRPNPTPTPPITRDYDSGPLSGGSMKSNKAQLTNSTMSTASTLIPSNHNSLNQPPTNNSLNNSASSGSHQSNAAPTPSGGASGDGAPSVEIFKSFRVGLEDPCYKVLPAALRKYNINADWRQYALYIVYGDQERCVGLDEKPLALFKDLDREGKKPMFMLRRLQGDGMAGSSGGTKPPGLGGGGSGGLGGGMGVGSTPSVRTMATGTNLPGGVL